jgi:hypothetical protein
MEVEEQKKLKIPLPKCCKATFHNVLLTFIFVFLIPIPHAVIIIYYSSHIFDKFELVLILIFSLLFYIPLAFCLCSHMGYTHHMNFN